MAVTLPDRALTFYQPYAWLVVHGHKPIENRRSLRNFRGDFWIHASAAPSGVEVPHLVAAWKMCRELCDEFLGIDFHLPPLKDLPFGKIVGRATITGVIEPRVKPDERMATKMFVEERKPVPWHFEDQYGLIVERPVVLASPVPARGYQNFWRVPAPTMDALRAAA